MIRYLMVHPRDGVFLGTCLGLAFWSALDPAGQDLAAVFETEDKARGVISAWKLDPEFVEQLTFPAVECEDSYYATREECARAGAPIWAVEGDHRTLQ